MLTAVWLSTAFNRKNMSFQYVFNNQYAFIMYKVYFEHSVRAIVEKSPIWYNNTLIIL